MKLAAVVLARMGSQRLPGKVLLPLHDECSILEAVILQLARVPCIDAIVLATTIGPEDDVLVSTARRRGIEVFRGASEDVLRRFLRAADAVAADFALRVNADSPFVDAALLEAGAQLICQDDSLDLVTNLEPRSFPYGITLQMISITTLERLCREDTGAADEEHITPLLHRHLDGLRWANVPCPIERRWVHRLTVDTKSDYTRIIALLAASASGDAFPRWDAPSILAAIGEEP